MSLKKAFHIYPKLFSLLSWVIGNHFLLQFFEDGFGFNKVHLGSTHLVRYGVIVFIRVKNVQKLIAKLERLKAL